VSDASRAERSRAAFAKQFPQLTARLARAGTMGSSAVIEAGVAVDIIVDERRIYGGDARQFTRKQVAAFIEKPLRVVMQRPDSAGLISEIGLGFTHEVGRWLKAEGLDEIQRMPSDSPTFLVVFGLGLGHHIDELVRHTKARWLIIAEPLVEFFQHSFATVDWQELFDEFAARGGGVQIVSEIDPGAMVKEIVGLMADQGIPYADGSWIFTHYPLWAFSEARKRLYEALEFAFINRGFFEDELRMMDNAVENFAARSFWLLEGKPRRKRPETAVVVGAGPSLDEGFDALRRLRDRIVLFSAGTALRPLLRNGFVPDYHCELENVATSYDAVCEAAKFGDLSKITLVASATVDPRIPPLFGDIIFYFRDSVSSTAMVGRDYQLVPFTAPTCVNTALSTAAFMGFTEFLLFGTDCGVRPGASNHASGTVYDDIESWRKHDSTHRYPLEIEGNFGGIANTDWVYDACRLMAAHLIRTFDLHITNCSDGAFIPGTLPCVPESVDVPNGPVDRAAFRAALERSMRRFAPAEILAPLDFAEFAAKSQELIADLRAALDALPTDASDFNAVFRAVGAFTGAAKNRYRRTEVIPVGTLRGLPRIAMFFGYRLSDKAQRQRFYDLFMAGFHAVLTEMDERMVAHFARLGALARPERQSAFAAG
jgi:hypothetical protein